MEDNFRRYPFIEIIADPLDPEYKIKYTECVKDYCSIRFERREAKVSKSDMELLVDELMRRIRGDGR
jgi:hypothetical protein